MNIQIIKVPYDCGYRMQRQGLGPARFLQHNIDGILEADGHQVKVSEIASQSDFTIEVMTAFELNRLLADEVRQTIEKDLFPISTWMRLKSAGEPPTIMAPAGGCRRDL